MPLYERGTTRSPAPNQGANENPDDRPNPDGKTVLACNQSANPFPAATRENDACRCTKQRQKKRFQKKLHPDVALDAHLTIF